LPPKYWNLCEIAINHSPQKGRTDWIAQPGSFLEFGDAFCSSIYLDLFGKFGIKLLPVIHDAGAEKKVLI
jgi:hypothetical protein